MRASTECHFAARRVVSNSRRRGRPWWPERRFVPFGVFTERKTREKLDYMHNNPVKHRLVASPADWPWSSWRYYYLDDRSVLELDRLG
jgi:putative transposase